MLTYFTPANPPANPAGKSYLALGDERGPALGAGVADLYGVVADRTAPVVGRPAPRQRH